MLWVSVVIQAQSVLGVTEGNNTSRGIFPRAETPRTSTKQR